MNEATLLIKRERKDKKMSNVFFVDPKKTPERKQTENSGF